MFVSLTKVFDLLCDIYCKIKNYYHCCGDQSNPYGRWPTGKSPGIPLGHSDSVRIYIILIIC